MTLYIYILETWVLWDKEYVIGTPHIAGNPLQGGSRDLIFG